MEPASSRPVLTSLASVAFALAVLFLFLAVRGIWPLGGHYLEYMDNGQMVYPTLKYYASALMTGAFDGSFFYDVNGGAGIRVSPSLPHQLLVPSTWIVVAMGDSFLLKDMVWVMLADAACICLTASWFLRRVFPSLPVCWTVLLTAGYALGGFFQTKYGFMQFLDHAAMFPLFALGLYQLVNGGRGWLYAVGLFLLATSMYSAFMAVVTGWLFAWAFTLPLKGTAERRVRLARVFWYTAAVTLATCYYWLPMMEMSRDSMRSLFMTPPTFFELSWPFDPPKFLERLYSCLPGMACAALAAVYLVYGRKEAPPANRGRRLFLLLLAASVLPAFIEPLHRAAHLWSYVDFPVRFGFIPNLVVASFCAWILSGGRLPQPAGRRWGWGWSLGLPVAAFAVSLIVLHVTDMDLVARLLPLLFFSCAWLCWRHAEGKRLVWSIAAVMLLGLPVGAAAFWKQGEEEKAAVLALNAEWLARGMDGYAGLLRVKDRDRLLVDNVDCLGPVPSIGNFRHTTSISHFRFLKNLGYRDEFTRTYGQGGHPVFRSAAGPWLCAGVPSRGRNGERAFPGRHVFIQASGRPLGAGGSPERAGAAAGCGSRRVQQSQCPACRALPVSGRPPLCSRGSADGEEWQLLPDERAGISRRGVRLPADGYGGTPRQWPRGARHGGGAEGPRRDVPHL